MKKATSSIWVFADYRNYFQNRITLQLLAKANDLASELEAEVCAVVFGYETTRPTNMWPNTLPTVLTKFWWLNIRA